MARRLINAMIPLVILYSNMTRVDEFININIHKLIKR